MFIRVMKGKHKRKGYKNEAYGKHFMISVVALHEANSYIFHVNVFKMKVSSYYLQHFLSDQHTALLD